MADFTLSKPIFGGKQPKPPRREYCLCPVCSVLFLGRNPTAEYAGACSGVYEHLMQVQDTGRPRVEIGLGVSTVFGLIPFLAGSMVLGVIALVLRWRNRH